AKPFFRCRGHTWDDPGPLFFTRTVASGRQLSDRRGTVARVTPYSDRLRRRDGGHPTGAAIQRERRWLLAAAIGQDRIRPLPQPRSLRRLHGTVHWSAGRADRDALRRR